MRSVWLFLSFLFISLSSYSQGVIKGHVFEKSVGHVLAFSNVIITLPDGKVLGTSADIDGFYRFELEAGTYELTASYVGYETHMVVDVVVKDGETIEVDFQLDDAPALIGCPLIVRYEVRPFTVQQIFKRDIEKENLAQDVPYLLKMTPSAVVTSDAGAGVGYTGIRIRGSDQTNINVTVNGIPLNDPESHQVYWVDLPDVMASANSLEIERGVGASSNGAGAFGATINVETNRPAYRPEVELATTMGSFNTQKYSLQGNTGTVADYFAFKGRVSSIRSDGYVDRASSNLTSYFLSGEYKDDNQSVKLNTFSGHEITYQAWNGIPKSYAEDEEKRTYNPAGLARPESPYPDEVDNYKQTHYQAIYSGRFSRLKINMALHYTKGSGYYENYKSGSGSLMFKHNIDSFNPADTIPRHLQLVRRKWLDNDFYGGVFNMTLPLMNASLNVGGGWNQYEGRHFGRIMWTDIIPVPTDYEYYRNDAHKADFNIYAKAKKTFKGINAFLDLQYRKVDYRFLGNDRDGSSLPATVHHQFFNPKVGLSYLRTNDVFYASFAVAHREPNRGDYKDSSPDSRPKAERLYDLEAGIRHGNGFGKLYWEANGFFMQYQDQLVSTGKLNDVGEYVRINVPQSYRTGLELLGMFKPGHLKIMGNTTLSKNIISTFTEYVDNWDTWEQETILHQNTDLAFSPSLTGALTLEYGFFAEQLKLALTGKYVGKQYLDNTSNEFTSLPSYFYNDLQINYLWSREGLEYMVNLKVNNLLDQKFSTNGWAYRYRSGTAYGDAYDQTETADTFSQMGLYPQAGRNFLLGLVVKFR